MTAAAAAAAAAAAILMPQEVPTALPAHHECSPHSARLLDGLKRLGLPVPEEMLPDADAADATVAADHPQRQRERVPDDPLPGLLEGSAPCGMGPGGKHLCGNGRPRPAQGGQQMDPHAQGGAGQGLVRCSREVAEREPRIAEISRDVAEIVRPPCLMPWAPVLPYLRPGRTTSCPQPKRRREEGRTTSALASSPRTTASTARTSQRRSWTRLRDPPKHSSCSNVAPPPTHTHTHHHHRRDPYGSPSSAAPGPKIAHAHGQPRTDRHSDNSQDGLAHRTARSGSSSRWKSLPGETVTTASSTRRQACIP